MGVGTGRRLAGMAQRGTTSAGAQGARADRGRRDPDHQGVVAWAQPYPYADAWALAAGDAPLLACLDQVTDPRNLGAVARSAAGAGATGVIVPAHGSATVTAAVCRSSAGAVEHLPVAVVPNLARYLAEIKRADLWSYAAAADAAQSLWQTDLTGGVALVFGAEGKGVRPLVRKTCDGTVAIPLAGWRRIAQRQRRGGGAAVRGAAAALLTPEARGGFPATQCGRRPGPYDGRVPEPTLYLFDGYNLLHAGGFDDARNSSTSSRASSRCRVREASSSSTASGKSRISARSPCVLRLMLMLSWSASPPSIATTSASVSFPRTRTVRGTSGQDVRTVSSRIFLGDLEPMRPRTHDASRVRDRLDDETRAKLERMRRGS